MSKLRKLIVGLALLCAINGGSKAIAADYFNAQPGPKATQVDVYGNRRNGAVVTKLFPRNLRKSLPNLVVASPFSVSSSEVDHKGLNIGYFRSFGDKLNGLFAGGIFKNGNGKYSVVNPQIYATHVSGPVSVDLEAAIPYDLESRTLGWHLSGALGLGIGDRFRIGGGITKNKDEGVSYEGNVRYELRKDHKYWMQLYGDADDIKGRLALNF
jgi:hypothetical protein